MPPHVPKGMIFGALMGSEAGGRAPTHPQEPTGVLADILKEMAGGIHVLTAEQAKEKAQRRQDQAAKAQGILASPEGTAEFNSIAAALRELETEAKYSRQMSSDTQKRLLDLMVKQTNLFEGAGPPIDQLTVSPTSPGYARVQPLATDIAQMAGDPMFASHGSAISRASAAAAAGDLVGALAPLQQLLNDLEAAGTAATPALASLTSVVNGLKDTALSTLEESDVAAGGGSLGQRLGHSIKTFFGGGDAQASVTKLANMIPGGGPLTGLARMGLGKLAGTELAPFLGPAAVVGGGAAFAFHQFQNEEEYRRELAQSMGRADLGTAVHYDLMAREMGANPFDQLSRGQSRQIIGAALQEGYQGRSADEAIHFATANFTKYGIEAGKSMQMYRTLVDMAGISTSNVSTALGHLADTAAHTTASMGELTDKYLSTAQGLTGLGLGQTSGTMAQVWTDITANTPSLKGLDLTSMMSNPTFQAFYARQAGVPIGQVIAQMRSDPGGATSSMMSTMRRMLTGANLGLTQGETATQILNSRNAQFLPQILQSMGMPVQNLEQAADFASLMLGDQPQTQMDELQHEYDPVALKGGALKTAQSEAANYEAGKVGGWTALYTEYKAQYKENIPLIDEYMRTHKMKDVGVVNPKSGGAIAWNQWIQHATTKDLRALAVGDLQLIDMTAARSALDKHDINAQSDSRIHNRKGTDFAFHDGALDKGEVAVATEQGAVGTLAKQVSGAYAELNNEATPQKVTIELSDKAKELFHVVDDPDYVRNKTGDNNRTTGAGSNSDTPKHSYKG